MTPVVVAGALAAADEVFRVDIFLAVLAVAALLQVAVNFANDLEDAVRGIDTEHRTGPPRAVASGLITPGTMRGGIAVVVAVATLCGVYVAWVTGPEMLLIGLAAVLAALGYSGGPRPYASLGLGEVSVFVFFGPVVTVGSRYAFDRSAPRDAWVASVVMGLLAAAILVANNLRDIPTDETAGKRTLAVRIGDARHPPAVRDRRGRGGLCRPAAGRMGSVVAAVDGTGADRRPVRRVRRPTGDVGRHRRRAGTGPGGYLPADGAHRCPDGGGHPGLTGSLAIVHPAVAAHGFAAALVGAFADLGLTDAVISPGSRNTPLTAAFATHVGVTDWSVIDERSAGFFALGIAKASGRPVALVCTSGTAAAEYHPAVVEANLARVPLLVLTADRPDRLRDIGAPQAIDQVKLYGDAVRWFHQGSVPGPASPGGASHLSAHAWALAVGVPPGPVHLNLPFEDDLVLPAGERRRLRRRRRPRPSPQGWWCPT